MFHLKYTSKCISIFDNIILATQNSALVIKLSVLTLSSFFCTTQGAVTDLRGKNNGWISPPS